MRVLDSPVFGSVNEPETFEELISLTLTRGPSSSFAVRMWRGQGDLDWPIHSSAYRRLSLKGEPVDERAMQWYEKGLLERATHRGFRQVDGRTLSDFDLLARLRHHGAATRLVDATRNALTALWFSVADAPDRVGALIGIHSDLMG
jgi:FRG domain